MGRCWFNLMIFDLQGYFCFGISPSGRGMLRPPFCSSWGSKFGFQNPTILTPKKPTHSYTIDLA